MQRGTAAGLVPTRCLAIGSSDSSGGAGIQGDIKALASIGCYATTVIIGVTAQNTRGVLVRHTIPPAVVLAQLEAVLCDIPPQGIKIGMTWSVEMIRTVAEAIVDLDLPIVLDPVMVTASGSAMGEDSAISKAVIGVLFPLADVVTPNLSEAQRLADCPASTDRAELSERLVELGARAVIITDSSNSTRDWLFDGSVHQELGGEHHVTGADHGAGCAHSALLIGLLAKGMALADAARLASEMAATGVRDGLTMIGSGRHPVDLLGLTVR